MKQTLRRIRSPKDAPGRGAAFACAAGVLLLGLALGVFAKWLDNLAPDSTIGWHRLLEALDLRNVFSGFAVWLVLALAVAVFSRSPARAALHTFLFFLGMCASYHLYTVLFSGFNPRRYMMIWYALTALSPLLGALCWFGKGKTLPSILIDACILAVLAGFCFSIGWVYFAWNGAVNALLFAAGAAVLFSSPGQTLAALLLGLALAFLICPAVPVFG